MRRVLVLVALMFAFRATPGWAVTIDWVPVGDAGNAPDAGTNCYGTCGSVAYDYWISRYEVTNAQYTEFLNARAASDPLGLYSPSMGSDGGITRTGASGGFAYTAKSGFENKPVVYVSFYDAARFANWLSNGQGSGDTESGAYTLLGGTATPSNGLTVMRNDGTNIVLPNLSEWYKAAYYDPLSATYFDYPTGTNSVTGCIAPGLDTGNSANCNFAVGFVAPLTEAGAYGLSESPFGTFDQGGNVYEWTEQIASGGRRDQRGGSWIASVGTLAASSPGNLPNPSFSDSTMGFRVAMVPEPATALLVMAGVLGLAAGRRPRAN